MTKKQILESVKKDLADLYTYLAMYKVKGTIEAEVSNLFHKYCDIYNNHMKGTTKDE